MRRLLLTAAAATFLIACEAAQVELTDEEKTDIAAEVNAVMDAEWLASTSPARQHWRTPDDSTKLGPT